MQKGLVSADTSPDAFCREESAKPQETPIPQFFQLAEGIEPPTL
jgi:hypothetical protein